MTRRLPILLLLVACIAPWVGLGARDLWNPDEADHAAAARELLVEGRWAVPTIAGDTFAEKPPLQLWGIILSAKLRGTDVDEFDARAPSAVGGMLLLTAAFLLGLRCGGPWHASLTMLATATAGEVLLRIRWCQVDGLFAGLFAWSAILALETLTRPRLRTALLAGAVLGLAVLTKGPLAVALLVAGLGLDWVFEGSLGKPWPKGSIGRLLAMAAVAAAVALPWYAVLASRDTEGLGRSFLHENVKRFFESQDHRHPVWYYAGNALWSALAPVSFLLPPALAFAWTTAVGLRPRFGLRLSTPPYFLVGLTPSARGAVDAIHTRDARVVRFAFALFLGGFVLLSIASSKQGKYLIPLTPFAALIVADYARNVVRYGSAWQRHWLTAVLSSVGLALVVAALIALSASWFGPRADETVASMVAALGGPSEVVVPVSILVVPLLIHGLGGFALLAAGSGSRGSLRLGWLLASSCLATLVGAAPVFRAFDTVKSPRAAVELAMDRLDELRAGGAEPVYAVYFVDRADDRDVPSWTGTAPFVYYARGAARRPAIFRGVAAVRDALAPGKPPCVLVMRQTYHQLLPLDVRERLHPRFQKETGSRTLVVVDSAP